MTRLIRAALTETRNIFAPMPTSVDDLPSLAGRMGDIRDANLAHHIELAQQAAAHGVQVICFGELFTGPYFALTKDAIWNDLAEDAESGSTITLLRQVAREHQLILIAPIFELCSQSGERFNTAVLIDEHGEILGKYRKTHIPQGSNEAGSFQEKEYYGPSNGKLGSYAANISENPFFPVFKTSLGNLAMTICYDRHFPGCVETLAMNGAELIFSPAVTFGLKSQRLWHLEFATDATRHRVFIGGSNRAGAEPPWNQEFFGQSYFVGPEGKLAPAKSPPNLIIADIDLDQLNGPDSSGWSLTSDTRPTIYR
ncbi:MAG: beta-ureidopropionase [Planctomycetota bacterium]|jgi:beta-ureidopropionase